jgi:hypothetical protein
VSTISVSLTAPAGTDERVRRLAPLGLVVALALVMLLNAASWLDAGFGESHDGRNAALWGMSSRALRNEPIGSRLGSEYAPGSSYANHPPLIIGETAAAELVGGEHRAATRAPAWIGSLIALVLLCRLLLNAGLSPAAVAAGVVTTCGSAMFLVYGTMLDTPVTSLPVTLAVLLGWQRACQQRPWPWLALGAVGALAGLAGWQSFVFAALAAGALAIDALARRGRWSPVVALGGGAAIGLATTFAWIGWAYGSLSPVLTKEDTYSTGAGLRDTMEIQFRHLWDLMPLALAIAAVGLVIAVRDPRVRALLAVCAVAVVGYAAAFRGAAEMHDYWNYAILLPIAIAVSSGFDRLIRSVAAPRRTRVVFVSLLVAAGCLAISVAQPSDAEYSLHAGVAGVSLAHLARDGATDDGPAIAYLAIGQAHAAWIDYETGRPGLALGSVAELERLAADRPDFPVLVAFSWPPTAREQMVARGAIAIEGSFALVPADVLYRSKTSSE